MSNNSIDFQMKFCSYPPRDKCIIIERVPSGHAFIRLIRTIAIYCLPNCSIDIFSFYRTYYKYNFRSMFANRFAIINRYSLTWTHDPNTRPHYCFIDNWIIEICGQSMQNVAIISLYNDKSCNRKRKFLPTRHLRPYEQTKITMKNVYLFLRAGRTKCQHENLRLFFFFEKIKIKFLRKELAYIS